MNVAMWLLVIVFVSADLGSRFGRAVILAYHIKWWDDTGGKRLECNISKP